MARAAYVFVDASRRRWWLAAPAAALLAGLLVLAAGWGSGIERGLRDLRDGLRQQSASGQVVIVEIDARSLRALDRWPWPRRYHADLIDRLAAAQAGLIAFDVNFEAASNAGDDAALAAALQRAGGLVALPTFHQNRDSVSFSSVETLPHEAFRDEVFLAGVNVMADADGLVRRMPLGIETAGTPRPAMASLLAEAQGAIDQELEIDFAIDPATIPRLSYIDVLEGRFTPQQVAGKRLFVGGTAADMGDRYAVPLHGVLPGIVVQTLAAETLIAGRVPTRASGMWLLLVALAAAFAAARPWAPWRSVAALATGLGVVLVLPLATEEWLALSFAQAPALALLAVAALGTLTLQVGERYRRRSLLDWATGLPNLKALLATRSGAGERIVVAARIDQFDGLAATLGAVPTAVLVRRMAERLANVTGQIVYRLDEATLAWAEGGAASADQERFDHRLETIAAATRAPVECGRPVDVAVGLGVSDPRVADRGGEAIKQQAANAGLAAERALKTRRPFLHFADAQHEASGWHLSLVSELGAAMAAGEVWNAYQPKLDLRTGRICGVETLVRWTHRERGPVGPDSFIPVIEANGRAGDLTKHVFRRALQDAARWHGAGHALSVAVNVSATLLDDREFIAWLGRELAASPVDPGTIIVEVTESAAVRSVEQAAAALAGWRALGVAISIDDYGTGQSSLGYLQRLPASELKIDKSFIQNLIADQRDAIMVRSTIALAHQLGMKVVAEGVEDAATLELLRSIGCDVAQGWLIGKAMRSEELGSQLERPVAVAA